MGAGGCARGITCEWGGSERDRDPLVPRRKKEQAGYPEKMNQIIVLKRRIARDAQCMGDMRNISRLGGTGGAKPASGSGGLSGS